MNNLKLNALTVIISSIIMVGCQNESKSTAIAPKKSESELKEIIKQQVDSLYLEYEKFGFEWIDFYEDEFIAIYPDSPVKKVTKDSLIAQWEGIYKKYDVQLVSRGKPNVIVSQDMAVSYNSFNEIFIDKTSMDTIKNVGTYIVNWRKQEDGSWKIAFETLQNN
ncbi:MAG: hypothetical protein VX798_12500 [Bacteroidota bacterium]|uniref:DUF4440 domain-containing protein n=1 Tax=Flagellimonas profundi TaxID=2915620 RepID=A0ABS3FCD9_9FLAO|nr:hypothetical protein [Allomuricauda profundi]MBO0340830.1 hypothetical protein [Allomuricauda profundi]MEC7772000.1 hypothetical protein [Bacteroidota bacterium]